MSEALFGPSGLRFWNENEIELRELFQTRIISTVKRTLTNLNRQWIFERVEGPCLCPMEEISSSYGSGDVFITNHEWSNSPLCLRAETTASSYAFAKKHKDKLPFCIYQSGKSFRRETNDGASASKLRFNEFWQLEFQCMYSNATKCDYRQFLISASRREIERFVKLTSRVVDSDRLPSYSKSTKDIEVLTEIGWREIASCSLRTDFEDGTEVCEISIGLDRIASLATSKEQP